MEPYSLYKAKVARNTAALVVLFLSVIVFSFGQSIETYPKITNLTVSYKDKKVDEIIQSISKITGLRFIYSSDKIDVGQKISFSVKNQPLDHVFERITEQTGLVFKRQHQYVMVKSTGVIKAKITNPVLVSSEIKSVQTQALPDSSTQNSVPNIREMKSSSVASDEDLSKYLSEFTPYFDADVLKKLDVQYTRKLYFNKQRKQWHLAVGPVINDYSAGLEIRAGLRSLYAIANFTLSSPEIFFKGYGVGSSLMINQHFSFTPAYLYSSSNFQKTIFQPAPDGSMRPSLADVKANLHKIKALIQYSPTPSIDIRLGCTFNYSTTKQTFHQIDYGTEVRFVKSGYSHAEPDFGNERQPRMVHTTKAFTERPSSSSITQSWMGWEAGVYYRINFSARH